MRERPNKGQYDQEYRQCPCFWGKVPAKYVRLFADERVATTGGRALDLGAGEGKNAFFLRTLGYSVTAVEVSRYACANFLGRMIEENVDDRLTLVVGDALEVPLGPPESYDLVVAYGLLHCLGSRSEVDSLVKLMQDLTRVGGVNIVSAFTDRLPVPAVQDYLSPTLLPENYVLTKYGDWSILKHENDTLVETHPTSAVEHEHSLFRLLARRER